MKKLIISILLFFSINVSATNVYVIENLDGVDITLTEEMCPFGDNSNVYLAVALLHADNIKILGCWTERSTEEILVIWNMNGFILQQVFEKSIFTHRKNI